MPQVVKIDELGRVIIPAYFREALGLQPKMSVALSLEGDSVILQNADYSCRFCGKTDKKAIKFENVHICRKCADKITELADTKKE